MFPSVMLTQVSKEFTQPEILDEAMADNGLAGILFQVALCKVQTNLVTSILLDMTWRTFLNETDMMGNSDIIMMVILLITMIPRPSAAKSLKM